MKHFTVAAITLALLLSVATSPWGQSHAADAFTVDGGGGTSTAGEYEITGSIGQMDAGPSLSGDDYEVSGTFIAVFTTLSAPDGTTLTISVTSANTVVISWPTDATDFVLEQNSDLSAPNWGIVSVAPVDDGITTSVTLPLTSGNKFFRLKKP